jgi:hypothetical protein
MLYQLLLNFDQQTDSVPVHRCMLEVMYIKWLLTTDQYNLQWKYKTIKNEKQKISQRQTGYEGNSTFIVPNVPTIFRGNAEENSLYRGDN